MVSFSNSLVTLSDDLNTILRTCPLDRNDLDYEGHTQRREEVARNALTCNVGLQSRVRITSVWDALSKSLSAVQTQQERDPAANSLLDRATGRVATPPPRAGVLDGVYIRYIADLLRKVREWHARATFEGMGELFESGPGGPFLTTAQRLKLSVVVDQNVYASKFSDSDGNALFKSAIGRSTLARMKELSPHGASATVTGVTILSRPRRSGSRPLWVAVDFIARVGLSDVVAANGDFDVGSVDGETATATQPESRPANTVTMVVADLARKDYPQAAAPDARPRDNADLGTQEYTDALVLCREILSNDSKSALGLQELYAAHQSIQATVAGVLGADMPVSAPPPLLAPGWIPNDTLRPIKDEVDFKINTPVSDVYVFNGPAPITDLGALDGIERAAECASRKLRRAIAMHDACRTGHDDAIAAIDACVERVLDVRAALHGLGRAGAVRALDERVRKDADEQARLGPGDPHNVFHKHALHRNVLALTLDDLLP